MYLELAAGYVSKTWKAFWELNYGSNDFCFGGNMRAITFYQNLTDDTKRLLGKISGISAIFITIKLMPGGNQDLLFATFFPSIIFNLSVATCFKNIMKNVYWTNPRKKFTKLVLAEKINNSNNNNNNSNNNNNNKTIASPKGKTITTNNKKHVKNLSATDSFFWNWTDLKISYRNKIDHFMFHFMFQRASS